jgi:ribonuclease HI
MRTTYRLLNSSGINEFRWFREGHSKIIPIMMKDTMISMPSDIMIPKFNFYKPFMIEIHGAAEWSSHGHKFINGDYIWYTDGSKTEDGTGAGVYCKKLQKSMFISLGNECTIFQAEVFAIESCARECINQKIKNKQIAIMSDSQAAIKAIDNYKITSKTVWSCLQVLLELAKTNKIKILWVPGHKGYDGNEIADLLAKKGAAEEYIGPLPTFGVSLSSAKTTITKWMQDTMKKRWKDYKLDNHSKEFILEHSKLKSQKLLGLKRQQLRTIVGMMTGHCGLRDHLHKMGLSDNGCRFCNHTRETAKHILCECAPLERSRFTHLGKGIMSVEDILHTDVKQILEFLKNVQLLNML